MLETSSALWIIFNDNLADFTAFDATLNVAFAADWKTKIDAANTVMHHSQVKDIAAQKTDLVLEQMELCRLKYNEVKFFAIKAFKNSESKQAEFGTDTYQKARAKHVSMVAFMDEMNKACLKYEAELLAAGMSQASLDGIIPLRDSLQDANSEQESYQRATPVLTQDRIEVLNNCYAATRLVIDAAMVVYYNDFARRNMFIYLHTSGDKNDSELVKQAVLDENPTSIYSIVYEASRQFILLNNGPANVFFFLADSKDAATKKVNLDSGEKVIVAASQLGTEGNKLFVALASASTETAVVEVEISLE